MPRSTRRSSPVATLAPTARAAAALLAVGAMLLATLTAGGAGAAEESAGVELMLDVGGVGTRSLRVTNFTGTQDLQQLSLTSGQPTNYRATVTDADYLVDKDFSLVAETGHLYAVTQASPLTVDTADGSDRITSDNITLNLFQGLDANGVLADITPSYLLNLAGVADCAAALTGLGIDLSLLPLATITDVCTAYTDAVTDGSVTDLVLDGTPIEGVDLTGLVDDVLGVTDGIASTTPFTNASYLGLGAPDSLAAGAAPATQLSLMAASSPGTVSADLLAALNAQITDVTGADVTTVVAVDDVVQALLSQAGTAAATLGGTVGGIADAATQQAVVNELLSIANAPISDLAGILDNLYGTYVAYPVLTATAPETTPGGTYGGTHTVTLISE